jgi:hypothetical protein
MMYFFLFFIWIWLLIVVFGDIFRSHDLGGFAKALWDRGSVSGRVRIARAEGHSRAMIGAMLGTSGGAARQRYGYLARA